MKKLVLRRETVRMLMESALENVAGGTNTAECPPVCGSYPHASCGGTSSYCRCSEDETYYYGCQTWIY